MKQFAGLFALAALCASFSFSAYAEETPLTLMDTDDLVVVLDSIEGDASSDYIWNLSIENKTDKEISANLEDTYLNGLALRPYPSSQILAAGEKGTLTATWEADGFSDVNMTGDITEVKFKISAFDTTDYATFVSDPFTVTPNGADAVEYYTYTPSDTDIKIAETDDYVMYLVGQGLNDWNEFELNFFVSNKSDKNVLFSSEDWVVNDTVECDPYWSLSLDAHTSAFSSTYWADYSLEGTGIESFDSVKCVINVLDWDSWDTIASENFSLDLEEGVAVESSSTSEAEVPKPQPRVFAELHPEETVKSTGVEGKTWIDFLNK